MKEIVRIVRSETSEAMDRQFVDEEKGLVGRLVLTMMQSPRTDLLVEKPAGHEVEFDGRIYGIHRIATHPGSTGSYIEIELVNGRSILAR